MARVKMECLECGKKFSVSPNNPDPRCPKCHGVDVDVDYDMTAVAIRSRRCPSWLNNITMAESQADGFAGGE